MQRACLARSPGAYFTQVARAGSVLPWKAGALTQGLSHASEYSTIEIYMPLTLALGSTGS